MTECALIESAGIEPQREQAGEPAHRAREVDAGGDILAVINLATVPLDIQQDGALFTVAVAAVPAAPLRHRQRETGQQHVVDARMEGGRNAGQQRGRHRRPAASA